jgi:hypothetical protein
VEMPSDATRMRRRWPDARTVDEVGVGAGLDDFP